MSSQKLKWLKGKCNTLGRLPVFLQVFFHRLSAVGYRVLPVNAETEREIFFFHLADSVSGGHKSHAYMAAFHLERHFPGLKMQNLLTPVTNKLSLWESALLAGATTSTEVITEGVLGRMNGNYIQWIKINSDLIS